jgi:hypothetical protein
MNIVRDDCDERSLRVDRMIDGFRKAQIAGAGDSNGRERRRSTGGIAARRSRRGGCRPVNSYTYFTVE